MFCFCRWKVRATTTTKIKNITAHNTDHWLHVNLSIFLSKLKHQQQRFVKLNKRNFLSAACESATWTIALINFFVSLVDIESVVWGCGSVKNSNEVVTWMGRFSPTHSLIERSALPEPNDRPVCISGWKISDSVRSEINIIHRWAPFNRR